MPANLTDLESPQANYWLVKLHEITSLRRGVMFRFIGQAIQVLILGNAGGIGLILGAAPSGGEKAHWLALANLSVFVLGVIAAAATLILMTTVIVKEAHAVETALHRFVRDDLSREEVLVFTDPEAFRWANVAAACGILSAVFLCLGALLGLAQVALFY